MRAVDTNVLVRLIVRDDPKQVAAAESFVADGAWVSVLALAEATWVLSSAYELDNRRIATAVEMLLEHGQLVLQDADVAMAALGRLRRNPALGYSDCLLVELARKAGHVPLGTFDRGLGRTEGAMRL
jgi:predicted nucleic-acid-binding protein